MSFGAARALFCAGKAHDVQLLQTPLGAWDAFNVLWADALNLAEAGEATHFAMLHSDVTPEPGWLDVLIAEMESLSADLVSAVVPIKDARGLTSCGIGDPKTSWKPLRRFTMHEIHEMPETFDAAGAGYPGAALLVNTACWVCNLRNPLFFRHAESGLADCYFGFPSIVARNPETKQWTAYRESEDWFFSRRIHALGAKVFCTRKVALKHEGKFAFPNDEPWGKWRVDEEATRLRGDE
jgi:hypothetical protein